MAEAEAQKEAEAKTVTAEDNMKDVEAQKAAKQEELTEMEGPLCSEQGCWSQYDFENFLH